MIRGVPGLVIAGLLVARVGEAGQSSQMTIRAVRLAEPLRVDGKLDEAVYTNERPMSDFIQNEPQAGAPATEKTEVWLTFDRDHVNVSVRCWETHMERLIANEMRRDNGAIWQGNDIVAFMFDTFYDRRNSFQFNVNAIGGRSDGQVTNERQWNGDWNGIWEVKTGRFEGGWTIEAAIPFKSLRYRPGQAQTWGFNVLRANRWKNELSFLTPTPAGNGQQNLLKVSLSATVVGLEAPASSRNLEVKPYAISEVTSDVNATPRISNDVKGDVGVDARYGISQSMTANFTYNTDFAQVEADEQQVNLTRFNLFFPEKREFFLENQGTFSFGGVQTNNTGAGDTPVLFYSRRIGLHQENDQTFETPIVAGGRLSGRLGRYSFGTLNIQTGDDAVSGSRSTNFSVVRVKRDLLRRSSVGLILTGRSARQVGTGANYAYGVDGTFAFFDNLAINTYWARTETESLSGQDKSYRAQLDYTGDRYGLQLERLVVGDHFNPEVGFVRRDDMRRTFGQVRFSPRPPSIKSVRKFSGIGSLNYTENGAGRLETRDWNGEFGVEFQNSDRFTVSYGGSYEFLPVSFRVGSITVPVGSYDSATTRVGFTLGRQRKVSASILAEYGTFYAGHKTTVGISQGRMNLAPQLSVEPTYSINHAELPQGTFTTHLVGSRVTYTMTPLMFASALLQYNSSNNSITTNVRLRWEYQPGSELFVVYNEQRDTRAPQFPALANRGFVVKINRLFRL